MATGLLYSSILEKENVSPRALELKIGLPNGTVGRAIARNSTIKPKTFAKIAKALPHLDLRKLELDLLAKEAPVVSSDEKAPLAKEQGDELKKDDWLTRLDQALNAATRAADAANRLAEAIENRLPRLESNLNAVEERTAVLESSVAALNSVVGKDLARAIDPEDGEREIGAALSRAFQKDQQRRTQGIPADADIPDTGLI